MRVSKRQLRRIIKEEKRKLVMEQRDRYEEFGNFDDPVGQLPARAPGEVLQAVKDAIVELFVMNGEVVTSEIFDHLRMNGFNDGDIDRGIDALGDQY